MTTTTQEAESSEAKIGAKASAGSNQLTEVVKSKVVMKYPTYEMPATFNRLEYNTNLNLPPSNWLTMAEYGSRLRRSLYQESCFGSFRIALTFPDCVGHVDVVSDAENIKKLLKLPYAPDGAISMIVHKVGNSLLIDEFDIQKYLLRKADDDWKWLRKFILEHIVAYKAAGHDYCLKDRSREALQSKNLLSKFLYYSSLQQAASCVGSKDMELANKAHNRQITLPIIGPVLPEPKVEQHVPDPKSSRDYSRNVIWTLEDIRMLLGVDLPIFGGPNRPAITLRLRDMSKPINVLTGIDYWLDNLMCNVPEVAMCYHVDGIVQKYEIIKTEDLPNLENSQFSPKTVHNVAHNILSFLKANATKEGHTYWLFKGRNADAVKLYDLTTLYSNQANFANGETDADADADAKHNNVNPFTVPVGMLMYSVARNMKKTSEKISAKTAANMCALLGNCLKLLPKEKYPQFVSSSHYMLSDLYVPEGIDPTDPKFDESDSDTQSIYDDESDDPDLETETETEAENEGTYQSAEDNGGKANISLDHICSSFKQFRTGAKSETLIPLTTDPVERCRISLKHICAGLSCLQFFNAKQEESFLKESEARAKQEEHQRVQYEEKNPNMAEPCKPIPMGYAKLTKSGAEGLSSEQKVKNSKQKLPLPLSVGAGSKQLSKVVNSKEFGSWDKHLKLLLIEKACLTYITLADYYFNKERYGSSLKANYIASRCQIVLEKLMSELNSANYMLSKKAGDCFYMIAANRSKYDVYLREFDQDNELDDEIIQEMIKEFPEYGKPRWVFPENNTENLFLKAIEFYKVELSVSSADACYVDLQRRLGSALNEMGQLYNHRLTESYQEALNSRDEEQSALEESENECLTTARRAINYYQEAGEAFQNIDDKKNLARIYCNVASLLRARAHVVGFQRNLSFYKECYNKAIEFYEKAKTVLNSENDDPTFLDNVKWEHCSAAFVFACEAQDCSSTVQSSYSEAAAEAVSLLHKALKLTEVKSTSKGALYSVRAALIHKRLAAFHHHQLLGSNTSRLSKSSLARLATTHYAKALGIYDELGYMFAEDMLNVSLEFIALEEHIADAMSHSPQNKLKNYEFILDVYFRFIPHLKGILDSTSPVEIGDNLALYESRLQHILKTLNQLCIQIKDEQKSIKCKVLYEKTLRSRLQVAKDKSDSQTKSLKELYVLLRQLKDIWHPPT